MAIVCDGMSRDGLHAALRGGIVLGMNDRPNDNARTGTSPNDLGNVPAESRRVLAIEAAIRILVPSGNHREILALFGNRVTIGAVDHWRKGRRGPPQWALDMLRERVAPIFAAEPGPGQARGKYNLPCYRKEKARGTVRA